MIFNEVAHSMNTTMHRPFKIIFIAKILSARAFLILGDVDRMANQFIYALRFLQPKSE